MEKEALRLECLVQAVRAIENGGDQGTQDIVSLAQSFYDFVGGLDTTKVVRTDDAIPF